MQNSNFLEGSTRVYEAIARADDYWMRKERERAESDRAAWEHLASKVKLH